MAVLLGSAYGKITIDTSGVTKSTKEAATGVKKFGQDLTKVSSYAAKGMAALTAEVVILKKAFEFGRSGAEVAQMNELFGILLNKVGAAPDLLQQMQRASKGTVDQMSLMNSTALLLAGTQGQLSSKLAEASPKLVEIAKAAQKLNPSLGDTTFLYDSLARGIKRTSPLILDNLGIIVKVGEANKAYAESMGITVELHDRRTTEDRPT